MGKILGTLWLNPSKTLKSGGTGTGGVGSKGLWMNYFKMTYYKLEFKIVYKLFLCCKKADLSPAKNRINMTCFDLDAFIEKLKNLVLK